MGNIYCIEDLKNACQIYDKKVNVLPIEFEGYDGNLFIDNNDVNYYYSKLWYSDRKLYRMIINNIKYISEYDISEIKLILIIKNDFNQILFLNEKGINLIIN